MYLELENWKKQMNLNYQYNYRQIFTSDYFQELPPRLQQKLLIFIIKRETIFFKHLFFEIDDGEFQEAFSKNIVTTILANLES
jgi:hypothetical protein